MAGRRRLSSYIPAMVAIGIASAAPAVAGRQSGTVTGADLFHSYCVACHGTDARGTGPLASSLKKRPADLTTLSSTNGGTFPADMVARIVDGRNPVKGHGGGDMPVWGEALLKTQGSGGSEAAVKQRIDALVDYLRGLQK